MYQDFDTYMLVASYHLPFVIVAYFACMGLAKILALFNKQKFRWGWYVHLFGIFVAGAIAPFILKYFSKGALPGQETLRTYVAVFVSAILTMGLMESVIAERRKRSDEK